MQIKLRWLGNAGFEFRIMQTTLIVDPFLTRPKLHQVFFGRVQPDENSLEKYIPHCDHILVTHTHFDHCMDAPSIARRTRATVHGSHNTCQLMRAAGLPEAQVHEITCQDEFQIGGIDITVLPAAHPWLPGYTRGRLTANLRFPLRLPAYRMDGCFSFLLQAGGKRMLVWNSTHSQGAPQADLLTCRAVSGQRWYRELLNDVKPNLILPQHWDDFFRPLSEKPLPFFSTPRPGIPPLQRIDLQDFKLQINQAFPHSRVLLPEIFKEYSLVI